VLKPGFLAFEKEILERIEVMYPVIRSDNVIQKSFRKNQKMYSPAFLQSYLQ
jgi:hypothetical protein